MTKPYRDRAEIGQLRTAIAELYRATAMTQQDIANHVGVRVSEVNTAIDLLIPRDERARLVSIRRRNARLKDRSVKVCPHCGKPVVTDVAHPQAV